MEKINTLIWDELVNLPTPNPEAELRGFLETLPHSFRGTDVLLSCPKLVIGRRLLKLWRGLKEGVFNATITPSNGALELDKGRGKAAFKLSKDLFEELIAFKPRCNRDDNRFWFRGVWGGCGAIYLPQSGYYMVLRVRERLGLGRRIAVFLRRTGIEPGIRMRQGRIEYMIRDQEEIVTCLSKMELARSSLLLEEAAIVRSVRSRANKLVNCDTANINKSLHAARAQQALVNKLDEEGLWDLLSPELAELAMMRRARPSASLSELGQNLSRPVSKSTVMYRWKKLDTFIRGERI